MKLNKYIDRKELAAFFREFADALENGGADELACVDEFSKIKIGVKDEFGQIHLKVKVKAMDAGEPSEGTETEAELGKPKYKRLKKRMKSSFKLLVKTIHDGEIPPVEAVESFLADSALMVTYPGYGDEFYDSYTKACQTFKTAFGSGDLDAMHKAIDALAHEKSRCHAKYD